MRQFKEDVVTKRAGGAREGAIDEAARTATFVFSSNSPDRMGDIIDQKTWQLDRYLQNPQFLWAHRSRDLPIGKTVALEVKGNKLIGTVQFASKEESEFADTCWNLVKGGYLNAVSVGFRPHKWESYSTDTAEGYKFFDCELLECSLVPIPCNQDALLGRKDLGPVYSKLLGEFEDDMADVFAKEDLEAVVKSFGTNEQPESKKVRDMVEDGVYDQSGELMGVLIDGALKLTKVYQDKLRARNVVLIDEQAEAKTAATTEQKTVPVVAPNFYLKRKAARALARRTLLGV